MSDLFIPKKINVGFQNRQGTYTGRLAYVIYYDNKGVLRKEKSWQGWRDHKIAPEEFENKPQDGFCLNKDVKRYNWSHFGSNRSYIRMYDPRGIEFEVTPENLIGILTETDCLKRGLEGKFVYAWHGTELVLLPCASEAFTKATEYTERQDQNISAKDLKPGHSYTTKKGEEVIYIGRFPWFQWSRWRKNPRQGAKQHIFITPKTKESDKANFFTRSDASFLAVLNSTDPVMNYAALVDEWNSDVRSAVIVDWESSPKNVSLEEVFADSTNSNYHQQGGYFVEKDGDVLKFWSFGGYIDYDWRFASTVSTERKKVTRYSMEERGSLNTKTMVYTDAPYSYHSGSTKEKIFERTNKSVSIFMVLSNGKKIPVNKIEDVCR